MKKTDELTFDGTVINFYEDDTVKDIDSSVNWIYGFIKKNLLNFISVMKMKGSNPDIVFKLPEKKDFAIECSNQQYRYVSFAVIYGNVPISIGADLKKFNIMISGNVNDKEAIKDFEKLIA